MAQLTDREKFDIIMGETFKMHAHFVANYKMVIEKGRLVFQAGLASKEEVLSEIVDLSTQKLNETAQQIEHLFQTLGMNIDTMSAQSEKWEKEQQAKLSAATAESRKHMH